MYSPVLKTFACAANATVILIHVTPNETGACRYNYLCFSDDVDDDPESDPLLNSICTWLSTQHEALALSGLPPLQIGPCFDALPSSMRLVLFEESKHINNLQELAALVHMHEGLSPPKVLNS
ncbi:hypothetical protein BDV93DRAFT_513914 [Ceratobasidium sp. AG-I]|nr:hypothetical protein BDV93DRAFT_513914 [Ceratobasidium sp. AG-I]